MSVWREGKVQNLRGFTVQVRAADSTTIIGTAFAVSRNDGLLLTCRHVVQDAGIGSVTTGTRICLYIPQLPDGIDKLRYAHVMHYFPDHDDDLSVLQLEHPPLPPQLETAILGAADTSYGNRFRSFGYRRLNNYQGLPASGEIIDFADKPADRTLYSNPIMLTSQHIDSGMSGAAVLDIERNLVIGIIAETWDSAGASADRDTSFAVDGAVLRMAPLQVPLYTSFPLVVSPQPQVDVREVAVCLPKRSFPLAPALHAAPPTLAHMWSGRPRLLEGLTTAWHDPTVRMAGLIGFGGEGKSSLVRRWVDLLDQNKISPDGIFWWSFLGDYSTDSFLAALLTYLGGQELAQTVNNTSLRAELIGALLRARRFLLVLDGFEMVMHSEGDSYGLIENHDLRRLIELIAAPGHASLCIITSRIPLLNVLSSTGYYQYEVSGLDRVEARALLRNLGVRGSDGDLDDLAEAWKGHALALTLLGGNIKARYDGDLSKVEESLIPKQRKDIYDGISQLLDGYDRQLHAPERAFLHILSAFRSPVDEDAFEQVFRRTHADAMLNAALAPLSAGEFAKVVAHLTDRRLLIKSSDNSASSYTAHPLVLRYYAFCLECSDMLQVQTVHNDIKDYYLIKFAAKGEAVTLDDLKYLIEAVYHACGANLYDEAYQIWWERIYRREKRTLINQLGAYDTNLLLLQGFFSERDFRREPQLSDATSSQVVLNEAGHCLMSLGHLREALGLFERSVMRALALANWSNASMTYQHIAHLHIYLGNLVSSKSAAEQAIRLDQQTDAKSRNVVSLTTRAWVAYLQGELGVAEESFDQAERLLRIVLPGQRYLYGLSGTRHADFLRRSDATAHARQVAEANLEYCQNQQWPYSISRCYRVLGDLDAHEHQQSGALRNYTEALAIARSIPVQETLILALLSRGSWAAKYGESMMARNDLREALEHALTCGFRVYEIDIRVGLAWLHRASGNIPDAYAEAECARQMSIDIGYHWGQVDAAEVLQGLHGVLPTPDGNF